MSPVDHDAKIVALGEIYELAAAIEAQSRVIREYCYLGDVPGLEHAIRGTRDCLVRAIGEFHNLPAEHPKRSAAE